MPESRAKALLPDSGSLPMKIHEAALYPFAVLYDGATRLRNHLYELEIKKSCSFAPVVINVGNLAVGGTGKTPMTEYLIGMLHQKYKLAVLSRGYGRRTYGFRLAGEEDTAETLGDEPFQIYRRWKGKIVVGVGAQRVAAIADIMFEHPETEVILLDDAYQHRPVVADMNILLTTWQRPFFQDYVLPAGRLREARKGAKRAHAVVVTKCPDNLSEDQKNHFTRQIRKYAAAEVPVYFTGLQYGEPKPTGGQVAQAIKEVVLVTGLANARLPEEEVRKRYNLLKHFEYPDHHRYTVRELSEMVSFAKDRPGSVIITTEKDVVKWINPSFQEILKEVPVYFLPVKHYFLKRGEVFEAQLLKTIAEKKKV